MPMGVTNGNAAFQRMLENLLEPVRDCADPFVDDVIIASGDPSMSYEELLEAHERDVTRVLTPMPLALKDLHATWRGDDPNWVHKCQMVKLPTLTFGLAP